MLSHIVFLVHVKLRDFDETLRTENAEIYTHFRMYFSSVPSRMNKV
jgi:hypothetical protein